MTKNTKSASGLALSGLVLKDRMRTLIAAGAAVAITATGTVVVPAVSGNGAVAYAQEAGNAADAPKTDSNVKAYQDAIFSPGDANNKGTISGSVKEIQQALVGFGSVQDTGKALKGVRVYAQWYEGVNTEHASPVYYTESDENGNFTLQFKPYVDAAGIEREFLADASVGLTTGNRDGQRDEKREKIRIWAELPSEMQDQYRLVHQPAAGIFPGATTTPTTQGDGVWGGNKITGVTIQYAQKTNLPQHLPKEQWVESTGSGQYGSYEGQAFWNLNVLQGALNHNTVSAKGGSDPAAAGLTVVGSYLNDEAVKKVNDYAKANFAGKTLRGKGWTVEDEQGLQKWINEQIAAEGPEAWIAETVKTTTAADGSFKLYWRGLYGNNWTGTGGGINPSAEKLHKLAQSRDEGTFINGNGASKHINMDWSYVQVLDKDGNPLPNNVGMMYPWSLGQWAGPKSGNNVELFGGDGVEIIKSDDKYLRWNIALYPAPLKFDVLEKNTYDNWARVGETIQTETTGLPIGEGLDYYIQWTDKNGNKVGECGPTAPGADTRIPSCPLTVPANVEHGDTFTARLYQGKDANGQLLAQDAFTVTTSYLEYPDTEAKVGEEATANPVFDNPATDAVEPKLETAEFSIDESKLPEGVTADQVKVDPKTGVVTFTPKAGQENKSFDIPVKMVDTAIQVPVYDENGEQKKGEDGQPLTTPRTVSHATAKFNVKEATKTAETVEPKYDNKLVVPGTPAKSEPKFTDKDGKDVAKPEGAKFELKNPDGSDYVAPEGYKVSVDPETGVVTVEAPAKPNGETAEELQVPVKVTYKDGSTDDVTAPFQLDTDGDGTPDVTDEDDDNDGIKDQDEKDKGSNPKDGNSAPTTIGDIPNQNGTVGKAIDPVKVVVTDAPAGSTVEVTGLPEGLKYNPETKQIEGTPTKPGTSTVKVVVKDKDGKSVIGADGKPVEKTFTFTVADKPVDGPKIVPGAKTDEVPADGNPKTLDDKISGPTDGLTGEVKDKDGKVIPGSKVEITPDGEIKVTVPEGTNPQDGKVTIKDKDGKDLGDIDIKITDKAPETKIVPGAKTDEVPADGNPKTLDDKISGPTDGLTGEVKDKDGKVIPGSKVEITPDGEIKVTVPKGTDPQDGKVTIKDKDGKDLGDIDIKITDNTAPSIDNVKSDDKKITGTGDRPNEDITVTFPDGTEAKTKTDKDNKFEVPVPADKPLNNGDTVKAKDGNGNESERTVGATDADTHTPSYGAENTRTGVKVGENANTPNPFATPAPVKDVKVDTPAGAKYWTFTPKADLSGIINGQAPTAENLKTEYTTEADKIGKSWDKFVEIFTPIAKPETKVDFTFDDNSTNSANAKWDLLGQDGKSILDPNGDADGDGTSNKDEIDNGNNPFDKNDKPVAPTTIDESGKKPVNPTDEKQGTGVIVNNPDKDTKVTATDEDGKDVPAVINPETGEIEVTPGADVDGPITVIVEDPELPGGKVEIEVPVNGHEKGRDDNKKPAGSSEGIDVQKCVATGLGLGIPFLALVPLALGQELNIPGAKEMNARISQQIQDANTALQQRAGIFNPQLAQWVDNLNNTLKSPQVQRGLRLAGLLAYGLVAGLTIADQCMPAEKQSSQKTDLFGSLSSKKDQPKDNASSKKDQPNANGSSKEAEATEAPATVAPATEENTANAEQPTDEAVQPEASATDTTADATGEEA